MAGDSPEDAETGGEEKEILDVVSEDTSMLESSTAVYNLRFFIMFVLFVQLTFTCMLQMTLAPVTNIVAKYYQVSTVTVEWVSNVGLLAELSAIPSSFLIGKLGVRKMLIIAAFLHLLAVSIQYPGYRRDLFPLVMASRLLVSVASNILQILPVKVSAMWFPPHERTTATGSALLSGALGNSIGAAQASLMIREGDANVIEDGLQKFFLSRLIIAGLLFVLIFFLKEKPPKPPSLSQCEKEKKTVDFLSNLKTLLTNKNFWILLHSMTFFNCVHYAALVLMNPLITSTFHKGYVKYIGFLSAIGDISAAIVMIIVAILLDKYRKYKLIAILVNVIPAAFLLCLIIVLTNTINFPAVFALYVAFCSFLYAYNVVFIEAAAETFYPIPEEVMALPILVVSSVYMPALNTALGAIIAKGHVQLAGYLMVAVYLLAGVFAAIMKVDTKRSRVDESSIDTSCATENAILGEKKL